VVWIIFSVAAGAAIGGDNVGFWIGDKAGYRLVRRYGPRLHVDESKIKIGRYLFERHGDKMVFFGRFVSVLRTYAAFLAGTNRMHWRRFLFYNSVGGVIWAGFYTFVAYGVGDAFRNSSATIKEILAVPSGTNRRESEVDKLGNDVTTLAVPVSYQPATELSLTPMS
jgi:membrane protein DedA with SNARE-associated domain